jgi:ribosome-associated heat shock protein Hsp15
VNEERAKPARAVRIGDTVAIRKPPFEHAVVVKGLSGERGPAPIAATLFEETAGSRARRTVLAAEMKAKHSHTPRFKGRPTKKTRRDYEKWLRSPDEE